MRYYGYKFSFSERTVGRARLLNSELASQVSKKLDEINVDFNFQSLQVIDAALAETLILQLQLVWETQGTG